MQNNLNRSMTTVKKKIIYGIIIVGAIALILRAFLPAILYHLVEKNLNKIPGYVVQIGSVSVSLYRGSYHINQIQLLKKSTAIPVPFFSANTIEFKVQWKKLLQGHLVAEVIVIKPIINFVVDPQNKDQQLSIDNQWRTLVTRLYPLPFNRISLHEGEAYFRSYKASPPFEVHLKNIESELNNLHGVTNTVDLLFSTLNAQAKTMDGADVRIDMRFNPFLSQPTFTLKAGLKDMKVSAANNLLQHYTKVKVRQGTFSVYMEAVAAKGKIQGYVKPFFKNLKITSLQQKVGNPIEYLYQHAVQLLTPILENSKHKTIATKIKISGDVNAPNTYSR
jgi:hypothetical protein